MRLWLPAAPALSPFRSIRAAYDRCRLTGLGFDAQLIDSLDEGWSSRKVDRTARRAMSMWLAASRPGLGVLLITAYIVIWTAAVEYPPEHVRRGAILGIQDWEIYLLALVVVGLIMVVISAVLVILRQWLLTRFGDPDRALGRAAGAVLREIDNPQTPELQHKRAILTGISALHRRAPRAGITNPAALEHVTLSAGPQASKELAETIRALMIDHVHGKLISQDDPTERSDAFNTLFGGRVVLVQATVAIVTLLTTILGLVKAFTR